MASKASLNSIYRKVLSTGNQDASPMYPPSIYEEHFNVTTEFIIDECVRLFPDNSSVVDVIRPFLSVKFDKLVNGLISFPENYRNVLGAAININNQTKKPCDCGDKIYPGDPLALTKEQLEARVASLGCSAKDIVILDIDEFNERTDHPYKKPNIDKLDKKPAIGCIFNGLGVKVCPAEISHAELYYVRKPKVYRFGYTQNPDDTIEFDPTTSEESEWDDTAVQYLFKGINTLYTIYTRDGEMRDWNVELKKLGLF